MENTHIPSGTLQFYDSALSERAPKKYATYKAKDLLDSDKQSQYPSISDLIAKAKKEKRLSK